MSDSKDQETEAVDLVRRRLLIQGGRYVAPAIIATLGLATPAFGQQTSCPPALNRCPPLRVCVPGRNCRPVGGTG